MKGVTKDAKMLLIYLIFGLVILSVIFGLTALFGEVNLPNLGSIGGSLCYMGEDILGLSLPWC